MAKPVATMEELRQLFASANEDQLRAIAEALAPHTWDELNSRVFNDVRDDRKIRWLHDGEDIMETEAGAQVKLPGESYYDVIDIIGGTTYADSKAFGRKLNISIGAGADCMADFIVSDCWADEVAAGRGIEGQEITTVSSCTFRIYSSLFQKTGSDGAFAQAVNDQADRIIWVCAGHDEDVLTSVDLSGLVNEQQIMVVGGGGPYRPNIRANPTVSTDALFTQPNNHSGSGWKYVFRNLNFIAAASKTPTIFRPSGGNATAGLEFWDCNFSIEGTLTSSGYWLYGLDFTGGAASNGLMFDNCRGQIGALARLSASGNATGPFVVRDCVMTLNQICRRTTAPPTDSETEPGNQVIITDNDLTINDPNNEQAYQVNQTTGAANHRYVVNGNTIRYNGTNRCFQFGNNGIFDVKDVTVIGNSFYCSTAGSSAIAFDNLNAPGGVMQNVCVVGNSFRGPGSGTAITVGTSNFAITGCTFMPNSFRDWATNVNSALPQTPAGSAPDTAQYLTLATDATLANERVFTPRYNLYGTDAGAGSTYTVDSWLEGAAITAAAGTLTLGTDGDVFHVNAGNFSAIATPTRQTLAILIHNGVSVETHGANLILQGAVNFTSAAGDTQGFMWEGGSVWREVWRHTAAAASGGGHEILDETTPLAQEPDLAFMGGGIAAVAGAGQTEIVVGAYYDAIVDDTDTNAFGKGNVYETIADALAPDVHKSIFIKSAGDTGDITIGASDAVERLVGNTSLGSMVPVNITSAKVGCTFEFLNFTSKRLKWTGDRQLALGCFFAGTITPGTGLTNNVPATSINIVSSTNATPISVNATAHGFVTGDYVVITGHTVNTNANGAWRVINTGANTFTLIGSIGNGVGGATGTATEEGVNAVGLSIPWDGGANGGLPSGGYAVMDNEPIGYRSGGGASSGTLVIGTTSRRGMWEMAGVAHPDNSTITDLTDGHLIIEANDCTVLTCQFIGCVGPYTHCIVQRTGKFRMRVVSSVFLANSTWSCVAMIGPNDSDTTYGGNTISACVFDTNTCYEALIDSFLPNSATNTNRGYATAISVNGCLFREFNNCAIRQHGIIWNISGNTFENAVQMTRAALVNRVGGISDDQNSIPYDTVTGLVGTASKGLALIDSEIVSFVLSGATMIGVGRGLMGTTAATHADNAAITFLGQIGVLAAASGSSAGVGPVALAGSLFNQVKIPALAFDLNWAGQAGSVPVVSILTCGINVGAGNSIYMGSAWGLVGCSGGVTVDMRSKLLTSVMSHSGTPTLLNPSSTSTLWTKGANAGGPFATGYQIPGNQFIALGRIAADLSAIAEPVTNRTGGTSVVGNIVIWDVANAHSVINAPVAAGSILVAGVCLNAVANLDTGLQLATWGVATINCDTGAVAIGDRLGTSAITAGLSATVAVPLFNNYHAIARTAKAAGANGAVIASLRLQ